jgi:cobalt-zinc-cadmium efflux system protein
MRFWIDGLLALTIAMFIGYNAIRNMAETLRILLQAVPNDVDIESLKNELMSVGGVSEIHDLHAWSLDGEHHVGTLHAVVEADDLMDSDSMSSSID